MFLFSICLLWCSPEAVITDSAQTKSPDVIEDVGFLKSTTQSLPNMNKSFSLRGTILTRSTTASLKYNSVEVEPDWGVMQSNKHNGDDVRMFPLTAATPLSGFCYTRVG